MSMTISEWEAEIECMDDREVIKRYQAIKVLRGWADFDEHYGWTNYSVIGIVLGNVLEKRNLLDRDGQPLMCEVCGAIGGTVKRSHVNGHPTQMLCISCFKVLLSASKDPKDASSDKKTSKGAFLRLLIPKYRKGELVSVTGGNAVQVEDQDPSTGFITGRLVFEGDASAYGWSTKVQVEPRVMFKIVG